MSNIVEVTNSSFYYIDIC